MSDTTPLTRRELHQTIEKFRKEQQNSDYPPWYIRHEWAVGFLAVATGWTLLTVIRRVTISYFSAGNFI
jgi:hypothetical protein